VQARNIFRATDVVGKGSQLAQTVDPEIRTRVGLDSESESDKAGEDLDADDEDNEDLQDHGSGNNLKPEDHEDDQNNGSYHGNDSDRNEDHADASGGNEDVDRGGPSRHGGHRRSRNHD
jgi:hypothetical protein